MVNFIVSCFKGRREYFARKRLYDFLVSRLGNIDSYDDIYYSGSNDIVELIRSVNLKESLVFHCVDEGIGCYFGDKKENDKDEKWRTVMHLYSPNLFQLMHPSYSKEVLPLQKISKTRSSLCTWLKEIFEIDSLPKITSDIIYIDQSFLWGNRSFRKEIAEKINEFAKSKGIIFSVKLHPAASSRDRELFPSMKIINSKGVNVPFELEIFFGILSPRVICSVASSASIYYLNMIDFEGRLNSILVYPLYNIVNKQLQLSGEMEAIFNYFRKKYPGNCKRISSWKGLDDELKNILQIREGSNCNV